MSDERHEKRIAIVGTAPTWKECPFDDPTLETWLLNDMHVLPGIRADRWFDLHPLDKMYFRDPGQKIYAHEVPVGHFVRPKGHLEFLRRQTIPVYVQRAADLGSPNARTFPKAEVEQALGPYFASSPAWMVGLALLEGVTELHIYGIHLATEWEYQKQKPNMTFLLGIAAGRGVKLVLPKGSPLLRESHQYAYQPDPDLAKVKLQRRLEHFQQQLQIVEKQLKDQRWWQRKDPNLPQRRTWLRAQMLDVQHALQTVIAGRSPIGA